MSTYQLVASGYFCARALDWIAEGKMVVAAVYFAAGLALFHAGRRSAPPREDR